MGLYNISLVHRLLLTHADHLIEEDQPEAQEKGKDKEAASEKGEREKEKERGHTAMASILKVLREMPIHSLSKDDCTSFLISSKPPRLLNGKSAVHF